MLDALGSGKLTELKQRLLFVLLAMVVFRVGSFIPVPGIDPEALALLFDQQKGTILDMFNMFSGGALGRLSLFALGVMPYISASIIMQLLSAVVPSLEQLKKEGEAGRRKITQYTRYERWRWRPSKPLVSQLRCSHRPLARYRWCPIPARHLCLLR
jgi:preprotein translocase subunit SecY